MLSIVLFLVLSFNIVSLEAWIVLEESGYCENAFDRQPGICIDVKQCKPLIKLLTERQPIPKETVNKLRSFMCGIGKNNETKVCCPNNDILYHPNLKLLPMQMCGFSFQNRITAGYRTQIFEFPWMALLAYRMPNGIKFMCGGTVITNRYVLTAAHCIRNLKSNTVLYGVRLGEHDIKKEKDCQTEFGYETCTEGVQDFKISKVIVHPEYDSKKLVNDIALIRLDSDINFNVDNVKPICLPVGKTIKDDIVTVAGWGFTENGTRSSILLRAEIPIISNEKCAEIYKKIIVVTKDQICAGGINGVDSCGGDSGGPVKYIDYIDNEPRYIQIGIVSYGPRKCGELNKPGIYTRLSSYILWILDNIKP